MLTSPTRAFPVDVLNCLIYCLVAKRTHGTGNLFFTPPPTPCKKCICEDLPQQSPTEANHTQLQEGFMIHTFSYCFRKFLSRAFCFSSEKCRCSMNIDTMLTTIKRPAPHSVFFSFGVGCNSPTMLSHHIAQLMPPPAILLCQQRKRWSRKKGCGSNPSAGQMQYAECDL